MMNSISILLINGHPRDTLRKQLRALQSQGFEGEIVIADGVSSPPPDDLVRQPNVVFRHIPESKGGAAERSRNFLDCVEQGSALCKSEFIALCPSDDLLDVDVAYEAADFLRANTDFVSCAMFALRSVGNTVRPYRQTPVEFDSWNDRICFHAAYGSSFTWAVHRRDALCRAARCVREVDAQSPIFSEQLLYFLLLLLGKIGRVDRLGFVKDYFDESLPKTSQRLMFGVFSPDHWRVLLSGIEKAVKPVANFIFENGLKPDEDAIIELLFQHQAAVGMFRIDRFGRMAIPDKKRRFENVNKRNGQKTHDELIPEYKRLLQAIEKRMNDQMSL